MKLAVLFLVGLSTVLADKIALKGLVFPQASSNSYVVITPQRSMHMRAFTLCMQVATELCGSREVILFAYRTKDHDELNLWREKDGRLSLYLASSSEGALFRVPHHGALKNHLCFTWDSSTGAANLFLNGWKSATKIYKRGHTVKAGGTVLVGQDPDSYLGHFDYHQSFVGEISDVNLWNYVLPDSQIRKLVGWWGRCGCTWGNVINWSTARLIYHGNVHTVYHKT